MASYLASNANAIIENMNEGKTKFDYYIHDSSENTDKIREDESTLQRRRYRHNRPVVRTQIVFEMA